MSMAGVWYIGMAIAAVLYMVTLVFGMRFILLRIKEETVIWRRGYYKLLGTSCVVNLVFCGAVVFALLQSLKQIEGW